MCFDPFLTAVSPIFQLLSKDVRPGAEAGTNPALLSTLSSLQLCIKRRGGKKTPKQKQMWALAHLNS